MTTKKERIRAILSNDRADRLPAAMWRHWPGDDQDAARLAESTLAYHRRFDWDVAKVTPSSSYCVEDWGVTTQYRGGALGEREYLKYRIEKAEDWLGLEELDVTAGALGRQLTTLRLLRAELGPEVPLLMTVFNSLAVARRLVGDEPLFLSHLRLYPRQVGAALETISSTCARFIEAALQAGADGVFLSTSTASPMAMNEAEYRERAMPHDLRLLEAAGSGWFNVLHLHTPFPFMSLAREYPVHAVNWDDRTSLPPLAEGRRVAGKAVLGGMDQWGTLQLGSPEAVRREAFDAMAACGGRGMLLSGGCTYPLTVPEGNLLAVRRAAEEFAAGPA